MSVKDQPVSIGDCVDMSPIIAAPMYPETEANDGRCRCGRLAVEVAEGCEWHAEVRRHRLERITAAAKRIEHERHRLLPMTRTVGVMTVTAIAFQVSAGKANPRVDLTLEGDRWVLTTNPKMHELISEGIEDWPPRLPDFPERQRAEAEAFALEVLGLMVNITATAAELRTSGLRRLEEIVSALPASTPARPPGPVDPPRPEHHRPFA